MATTKPAAAINLIILVLPCLRTLSYSKEERANLSVMQAKSGYKS